MKKLAITVFALLLTVQLYAQDLSFKQDGSKVLNRYYADIITKAATLNGDYGYFAGVRLGYNISENVSLGLVGYGLVPEKISSSYINWKGRDDLYFGYCGIESAFKQNLSDRVYAAGIMMIGAGRANYENRTGNDYFFIMEPGASINYRITDWFGIGYSVSYRLASGVKYADLSNASFSGWSTDLGFKFGF